MKPDGELPMLTGERVTLRPSSGPDLPALVEILDEPEVRHWWGENDHETVRAEMSAQPCWTILVAGDPCGWVHVHEECAEDYPSVAFDIAIGARGRGRGLGREALRLAIRHFIARGHHRFTIDPAAENEQAIRAYASIGFEPVGRLRACERTLDGAWRDGLLMDLLAEEFIDE